MQDRSRRLSRPLPVLALLLSVLMCYLIVSEWGWRSGTSYSKQTTETWTDSVPPETAGFSRIFFLETGGPGSLTARISCAVESAARVHPHWTVYILAAASGYASQRNVTFAGPFAQVLRSIPNVVVDVVRVSAAVCPTHDFVFVDWSNASSCIFNTTRCYGALSKSYYAA
nr:uncharacterized protein LOC126533010 [Dermacentor andersoni]